MKSILFFVSLILLASCSSSPKFSKSVGNLYKNDKVLGDELPDWVDDEEVRDGEIYAVGEAEYPAEKKPSITKEAAKHNAKMRITERMPTDYKVIAQRSLSDATSGEFNQFEISKGDLYGLHGVKVSRKFTTCRKIVRYLKDDERIMRKCFVRASVPVKNFNEAIIRTVKKKHGDDVGNKFSKILEKNLESELN